MNTEIISTASAIIEAFNNQSLNTLMLLREKKTAIPLIRSKVSGAELFDVFINALPEEYRQVWRCKACRSIMELIGNICTAVHTPEAEPNMFKLHCLMWPNAKALPQPYCDAVSAVIDVINANDFELQLGMVFAKAVNKQRKVLYTAAKDTARMHLGHWSGYSTDVYNYYFHIGNFLSNTKMFDDIGPLLNASDEALEEILRTYNSLGVDSFENIAKATLLLKSFCRARRTGLTPLDKFAMALHVTHGPKFFKVAMRVLRGPFSLEYGTLQALRADGMIVGSKGAIPIEKNHSRELLELLKQRGSLDDLMCAPDYTVTDVLAGLKEHYSTAQTAVSPYNTEEAVNLLLGLAEPVAGKEQGIITKRQFLDNIKNGEYRGYRLMVGPEVYEGSDVIAGTSKHPAIHRLEVVPTDRHRGICADVAYVGVSPSDDLVLIIENAETTDYTVRVTTTMEFANYCDKLTRLMVGLLRYRGEISRIKTIKNGSNPISVNIQDSANNRSGFLVQP
jgi:hypothetical protein